MPIPRKSTQEAKPIKRGEPLPCNSEDEMVFKQQQEEIKKLKAELNQLKNQYIERTAEITTLEETMRRLNFDNESLMNDRNVLQSEVDDLKAKQPTGKLQVLLILGEQLADKYAQTKRQRWIEGCKEADYQSYLKFKALLKELQ